MPNAEYAWEIDSSAPCCERMRQLSARSDPMCPIHGIWRGQPQPKPARRRTAPSRAVSEPIDMPEGMSTADHMTQGLIKALTLITERMSERPVDELASFFATCPSFN